MTCVTRLWRAPSEVPGPAPAGQAAQGPVPKGNPGWDTIGTDSPPSIAPDSSPDDPMSHGTPVASVAAAATGNAFGMAGVAPNALVMPVRTCWNPRECHDELTAASMNWAVDNGARVVNMSLVTASGHAQVEAAIAAHPDALFVAAADNFGRDLDEAGNDVFPCEIARPNVICVAASARGGALSSCTNFGAKSVDVAAPGEGLTVAAVGGGFAEEHPCGTSLATPQVSGLAALLFGAVPEASATSDFSPPESSDSRRVDLPSGVTSISTPQCSSLGAPKSSASSSAAASLPSSDAVPVRRGRGLGRRVDLPQLPAAAGEELGHHLLEVARGRLEGLLERLRDLLVRSPDQRLQLGEGLLGVLALRRSGP